MDGCRSMNARNGVEGAIISYRFGEGPRSRISRFTEKVLGQDQKKNGKVYRRRGTLDTIPHWKLSRGVLVVLWKDQRRVVKELKAWDLTIDAWKVRLTGRQARQLRTHSQ